MDLIDAPDKLILPFANSGGKNTIPVASQIGIIGGKASLTDGFPPLTRTPKTAGGIPPFGLDMNGILFEMSASDRWNQAGGGYTYDGTFATNSNVNGYPKGARILRTDGTGYWLNLTDGNVANPETSGAAAAGWVPDTTNGVTNIVMTNANVTLTQLEYGRPIIAITGALVSNLNLIFPNIAGDWKIINNTTGNFTITAKTASGSGAAVPGVTEIVCDATNVYSVSGSSKIAGDVVQTVYNQANSTAVIVAVVPLDDTIPQVGEGTQILTATIVPVSATDILEFEIQINGELISSIGTEVVIGSLYKDGGANAIASTFGITAPPGGANYGQLSLRFEIVASSIASAVYTFRIGVTSGTATFYLNGNSSGRLLGGVMRSYMQITEKKV